MSTFAEHLDRLWRIQELDRQVLAARQTSGNSQRRVADGQKKLAALQRRQTEEEAALKQMQVREREIEQELTQLDKRISQIETVEGSESAVEKHKAQVDELESEGISLLTAMTDQKERISATGSEITAFTRELEEQQRASKEQVTAADTSINAILEQRAAVAAEVPEEMMRVYGTLAEKYPGNVLTRAGGEFCAACSGELTMNLVVRAKAREEVVRCPHCNRILDPAHA